MQDKIRNKINNVNGIIAKIINKLKKKSFIY